MLSFLVSRTALPRRSRKRASTDDSRPPMLSVRNELRDLTEKQAKATSGTFQTLFENAHTMDANDEMPRRYCDDSVSM